MKFKKRYRVKITRWGYLYILITIIIAMGAANTGNNLLYLLSSALLALMMISGISSIANLTGLEVTISPPQEIFASHPAPFRVTLKRRRWPLPATLVGVRAQSQEVKGIIMGSPKKEETIMWLTFPHRGKAKLSSIEVVSAFPLGFFTRSRKIEVNQELLVFPSPIPTPFKKGEGEGQGEYSPGKSKGMGDEVLELRPYQEGDPLKRMDWKATARKGELIVREMADAQGDMVIVQVNRGTGNWEEILGRATYLILKSAKRGMAVGLILPDRALKPARGERHLHALLEALALA